MLTARLALAVLVTGAVAAVGSSAGAATPRSSAEKVSCATAEREVSRTTGPKRTAAQRRLKACRDRNTANKRTLALVRDGHFVGTRGDGTYVDWTFCANGKYTLRSTSGGSTGVSTGSRWRIADATYKSAGTFTAVVENPATGTSVGLARTGGKWQAAVARSFGELEGLGPVARTAATTC